MSKFPSSPSPASVSFEITHDRKFLSRFLTVWRTVALSGEMVGRLRDSDDPYAAYGYGRWLFFTNPGGNSLGEAERRFSYAARGGVADAYAALAVVYFIGGIQTEGDLPTIFSSLMEKAEEGGSELARYIRMEGMVKGMYGMEQDFPSAISRLGGMLGEEDGCDPVFWGLLGRAQYLSGDYDHAVSSFTESIRRGDVESYYGLAMVYDAACDGEKSVQVTEEGMAHGSVPCFRASASMSEEVFNSKSPEEQEILHRRIEAGLRYAMDHYDTYAYFLTACCLLYGSLGFEEDVPEAVMVAGRGSGLGNGACSRLVGWIHDYEEDVPDDLRLGKVAIAELLLLAVRRGDYTLYGLQQLAGAYVRGLIPQYDAEMEKWWLGKYYEVCMEDEDEEDAAPGLLGIYPEGFYYAWDVDEDFGTEDELSLHFGSDVELGVVHASERLARISRVLRLDDKQVVAVFDRNAKSKGLPLNEIGTAVCCPFCEVYGHVVFLLEDESGFSPARGSSILLMLLNMLGAAAGVKPPHPPTAEEMGKVDTDVYGGFAAYDDPDFLADDDDGKRYGDTEEPAGPRESASTAPEGGREDAVRPPKIITVSLEDLGEALAECNLCHDTLEIIYPGGPAYDFLSTEDLFYMLGIKEDLEDNIENCGGYMIDEWMFVDGRQVPMDLRSVVHLVPDDEDGEMLG